MHLLRCYANNKQEGRSLVFTSALFQGGMYVFQMFDYQSGGISLILVALMETIAISWFYGE